MSKTTADIRQMFLDYFHNKGHQVVPSSSLVPANDPTLLFTNAGMNQFKDVFLGLDQRSYSRATTAQRCVRAGGKHNDLENVGYTARHHTFFEMLGNFSFGDYFKEDAINFAWELLTGKSWFNLSVERLWVTVYASDDEAYDIWAYKIGVPKERIIRIGDNKGAPYASDNFWQMGDTGPCGPCTEIFYDHGEHIWGGPPGSPEEDGDRYIEIWNIVFMQYNRHADGTMEPLPKPSVDTGMGLERISAVLQGVHSNYEIDVFKTLIQAAADIIGTKDVENKSLRVIADHIRSCAFLIADGVLPSNEGRGYVLRRIIRRAVRHGNMLNAKQAFFYRLVEPLIDIMGDAANDLEKQKNLVEQVLKAEEEQFSRTLDRGLQLLDEELGKVKNNELSGEAAFKLYDTYGFPLDLTADVCRERNIIVDEDGFEKEMNLQRERARAASGFSMDYNQAVKIDKQSKFIGYNENSGTSQITYILHQAEQASILKENEEAVIFLEDTPFYAESGGQIGDKGRLVMPGAEFKVVDTQKYGNAIGHIGKVVYGTFQVGDKVSADIDIQRRDLIRLNHSATHLLHSALRRLLGDSVSQKGSLVTENSLRFDFSSMNPVTPAQLITIENDVNAHIRRNLQICTEEMDIEAARNKGAMALFGEKYDDVVRVLSMGNYSIELCGGTHAGRTGDIGLFRIVSESGIAAGIRRIEAVTGPKAIELMHQDTLLIQQLSGLLKGDKNSIADKVSTLLDNAKQLEKSLDKFKEQQIAQTGSSLANKAILVNETKLLISTVPTMEIKQLRVLLDDLKNQLGKGIIVLSMSDGEKSALIVGITKELTSKVKAGEIVAALIAKTGGKGGGRPDMAQAGGCDSEILAKSLLDLPNWLSERL